MRSRWKVAAAAALSIAGLFAGTQAASAATTVAISNLYSPNSYGVYHGGIIWDGDTLASEDGGDVCDLVADGTGPYFHMIGVADHGSYQFAYQHNVDGSGGCNSINGGEGEISGLGNVYYVDAWTCNGGTINGDASTGCYGRRYWNQYIYPGKGSSSLGTTNGVIY